MREPLAALVEEMDVRLAELAPEIVGDPKRSLFRIHRDVRFSNDKSPYKTNAACWFYHGDAGRGVGVDDAARWRGILLPHGARRVDDRRRHLDAAASHARPGIRERIDEEHASLRAPAARPDAEEAIRRARRVGDAHAHAARVRRVASRPPTLLRHQSFTLGRDLTETELYSPKLPDLLARDYARLLPIVRWFNAALGLRTLARR